MCSSPLGLTYLIQQKLADPENGQAKLQDLMDNATAIDGEPFKGLIRIDEISAQRRFGESDTSRDFEGGGPLVGSSTTRRMSDQLSTLLEQTPRSF